MSKDTGFGFKETVIRTPSGLLQGIYEESSDQKHQIGTQYIEYGAGGTRLWRYVKVGASGISRGQLQQGPAPIANHNNAALGGTAAANQREVVVVTTVTTALTANQYDNGVFHINDADSEGTAYFIESATESATPTIQLYDKLNEALAATTEFTLTANKYNGIIVAPTTLTGPLVGFPLIDLTALYYGWICTGGITAALVDTAETLVIGESVGYPATISVAGSVGVPAVTDVILGNVRSVNAASEYALIDVTNLDVAS